MSRRSEVDARVGLVLDLADDLLEDVLDGDDADRPSVLVGDDAKGAALPLQLGEEVVEWLRLREDGHVADRRLDRGVRAGVQVEPDQAVVVGDPAHLVGVVVLDHNQACVTGRDAAAKRLLDRLVGVDGHDRRNRGHHLANLLLVQVEDAAEHPGLAGVEDRRSPG